MAADVTLTRRRRMLAFLVEKGGSASIADANAFSELKLLAAHQAFSAIMEGLVDGGFVTWDGTTFTVTDTGRAEAELAPRGRGKRAAASEAAAPPVVVTETAVPEPVNAPPASVGIPEHGHDHGPATATTDLGLVAFGLVRLGISGCRDARVERIERIELRWFDDGHPKLVLRS
jgi:hypothetical protein